MKLLIFVLFLLSVWNISEAAPVTKPVQDNNSVLQTVITQILQAVSQPSIRLDKASFYFPTNGEPFKLLTLQGEIKLLFDQNINVPTSIGTGDSSTADLIPNVVATTKGYLADVTVVANSKDHPDAITTTVTFLKDAKQTPLEIKLLSKKMSYFTFRFASVDVVTKGLSDSKGDITLIGTCKLEQSILDLNTHTVTWAPAKKCSFSGKFDRATDKGGVQFDYLASGQ